MVDYFLIFREENRISVKASQKYLSKIVYTGCSITPCSAISQASCRSPDDRRGAALPQEDVGGHVGVNHTQKVSRKGDQSGQTPSGSGDPLRPFSRRRFCDAVWVRLRVLFFK